MGILVKKDLWRSVWGVDGTHGRPSGFVVVWPSRGKVRRDKRIKGRCYPLGLRLITTDGNVVEKIPRMNDRAIRPYELRCNDRISCLAGEGLGWRTLCGPLLLGFIFDGPICTFARKMGNSYEHIHNYNRLNIFIEDFLLVYICCIMITTYITI